MKNQKKNLDKRHDLQITPPLTSITIREKDQNGDTKIHHLIKTKKVKELKDFIQFNISLLKSNPIIDDFQTVPAICLKDTNGNNALHLMLEDITTWGTEFILQIAKLHPTMIHVENEFGVTPLDMTDINGNLEKEFLILDPIASKFGTFASLKVNEVNIPMTEIKKKFDAFSIQNFLNGKLIEACKKGNIKEVRRLIPGGANPHTQDKYGVSAISYAEQARNKSLLIELKKKEEKKPAFSEVPIAKKLTLPAYCSLGGIIGGALGATGCFAAASFYASSWAFPPLGIALTIIGGCIALGFIAGAIISKTTTDSTTPFLEKTEKNNNNENGNKNQGKTIIVSEIDIESSQSNTALRL